MVEFKAKIPNWNAEASVINQTKTPNWNAEARLLKMNHGSNVVIPSINKRLCFALAIDYWVNNPNFGFGEYINFLQYCSDSEDYSIT